jgi:16S rRNA U516 pseudouridylate synthase RsuA-like enzyme
MDVRQVTCARETRSGARGEIRLGDLAPGKWRRLTPQELSYLESVKERGAGGAE